VFSPEDSSELSAALQYVSIFMMESINEGYTSSPSNSERGHLIMFCYVKKFLRMTFGCCAPCIAYAETPSIGNVSENILSMLATVNDAAYSICYALGIGLLFSSMILYRKHRQNPTEIRLGQVILVALSGVAVGGLPFLVRLSDAGELLTRIGI